MNVMEKLFGENGNAGVKQIVNCFNFPITVVDCELNELLRLQAVNPIHVPTMRWNSVRVLAKYKPLEQLETHYIPLFKMVNTKISVPESRPDYLYLVTAETIRENPTRTDLIAPGDLKPRNKENWKNEDVPEFQCTYFIQ